MKKLIFYILIVFAIASCTDQGDPDSKRINLYFRNTSNEPVQVEMYTQGVLRTSEIVASQQSGNEYTLYTRSDFNNFGFITDSLVIKYPNGRGYICTPTTDLCISSKPSPVYATEIDFIKEGDRYYYILSQQDYADAISID